MPQQARPAGHPGGRTPSGPNRPTVAGRPSAGPAVRLRPAPLRRLAAIRRPQLSGRRMVILAMALFLVVVLASPLQTYLNRRASLAASQKQQQRLAQQVDQLQQQSAQWNDPAYIEREARVRLQYVRPGDTLYTVLNPDGTPRSNAKSTSGSAKRSVHDGTWNGNLWSSVKSADSAQ